MIYKSVAAALFSVAMATSALAQTATQVDPATPQPTTESVTPDPKPADDPNKTPSQTGGAMGTDNKDAMSPDAPKANTSDAAKGGLNCKDQKSADTAMANDSTKPVTKPQDCPTSN